MRLVAKAPRHQGCHGPLMHHVNGWGNETRIMFQPRVLLAAERLTDVVVVRAWRGIMFRHAGADAPITKSHMVPDFEQNDPPAHSCECQATRVKSLTTHFQGPRARNARGVLVLRHPSQRRFSISQSRRADPPIHRLIRSSLANRENAAAWAARRAPLRNEPDCNELNSTASQVCAAARGPINSTEATSARVGVSPCGVYGATLSYRMRSERLASVAKSQTASARK